MNLRRRVQKSQQQRLRDFETHLYFLWEARQLFAKQEDRFKVIASELRVLVGDHRPNRRLLLSLMKECDFDWVIDPPGPPFEMRPIPMVGWRRDPRIKELTAEIEAAAGDSVKLDRLLLKQAALRRSMPFAEYVEDALAVMIDGQDYSFSKLVRVIAQQLGGSHEDREVDGPLAAMQQSVIGHQKGHIAPLIEFCDLVLQVGTQFLTHVTKHHDYKPRRFIFANGSVASPPIDIRGMDEIRDDPVQEPNTGSDLQAEGTLSVWLKHPHSDWVTNSRKYNFGTVSQGGVSLRAVKEEDRTLQLAFEKLSGSRALLSHPLEDTGRPAIHVAVTWQNEKVMFYVNGKMIGEVILS